MSELFRTVNTPPEFSLPGRKPILRWGELAKAVEALEDGKCVELDVYPFKGHVNVNATVYSALNRHLKTGSFSVRTSPDKTKLFITKRNGAA